MQQMKRKRKRRKERERKEEKSSHNNSNHLRAEGTRELCLNKSAIEDKMLIVFRGCARLSTGTLTFTHKRISIYVGFPPSGSSRLIEPRQISK